ncbi:MAG: hypothetical protein LQ340_003660 [Diploschistes diacapsis]|nr:MAG: hypothetical protein LQ340_003660 [Diploschistes diacapsis]
MSDAGQNNPLLTSADPLGSRLDSSYNPVYDGFIDLTNESSPPRPLQLSESSFSDPDIEDESISFLQEESPRATDLETMPRLQTPLQQEPSRKRRRLNSERASQSRRISSHLQDQRHTASGNFITLDSHTNEDHEEVLDLTAVDGIEALSKAQQQQKERHFALQEQQNQLVRDSVQSQISENKGPFKLGQLQCVICMDNMTDMTATHCG